MTFFKSLLRSVFDAVTTRKPGETSAGSVAERLRYEDRAALQGNDFSPGQTGAQATVEIDPRRVGPVKMSYSPSTDGNPDPGEIVWTWVPFEERDGRGKDRPVLIVAEETGGTLLAAQLTSKNHGGEQDFIPIGSGPWDAEGRQSWVNLDRIFRVHTSGMRREASALDRKRFALVASALHHRFGWK